VVPCSSERELPGLPAEKTRTLNPSPRQVAVLRVKIPGKIQGNCTFGSNHSGDNPRAPSLFGANKCHFQANRNRELSGNEQGIEIPC
jgi:hypothetical protein